MKLNDALERAKFLQETITRKLHDLSLSESLRSRVSGACFAVALDHQQAMVFLLQSAPPMHSSAFALARPVYESYVRGLWLLHCASEEQIESFSKGGKPPDMASLIRAIEKAGDFTGKQLSKAYAAHWNSLSSFTHTGGLQVQRWNTSTAIEPSFDEGETSNILNFASAMALLSAISVAAIAENEALAREFLALAKTLFRGAPPQD